VPCKVTIFTVRSSGSSHEHIRKSMKLIVPMAGRGTRVRPHSHVIPKPLLSVRGRKMVARIIDTFARVLPGHLDDGVFVLGPDFGAEIRRQLEEICAERDMAAHFVIQDPALGTAHAVQCAGDHLTGDGVVVFADTVFDMEPGVKLEGADVVAWVKDVDDPSRFGVAVREGDRIVAFVEKPKKLISREALIGIYYIRDLTELRGAIQYILDNDVRGPGGEYFLTDAFDRMLKQGKTFKTATVTEWLDCGTIEALSDTTFHLLEKEQDDSSGARLENSVVIPPVYVGPNASVVDSVIGPYVSIENDARITGSVLSRTIVFEHATVERSLLANSLVGRYAEVREGPRSVNIGDHSVLDFE